MDMLNKKIIGILVIAVAVLVAAAVWVGMLFSKSETNGARPSAYSAVMLANGDVYFGKIAWFPSPRIYDAWILQRSVDENNQVQLDVVRASRAFWSPVDEVNLNFSQIVSWTRLRRDSQLVRALENPNLLQQISAPQGSATSTFKGPAGGPPADQ